MKSYIVKALPFVIMLTGLALLLYPTISDHVNEMTQTRVIQSYNEITGSLSEDDQQKAIDAARQYNRKLAAQNDAIYSPWSVPGYYETLDITGTGIMGYITIEKIKVELPIYHDVDENVLQIAVGHLPGTSLPVGGKGTHAVLSGHRGLPSAKLFTDLDKLEVGDVFYITVLSEVMTYQVDQIKTVSPHNVEDLLIDPNEDYCTLFTCTPYGVNTHRMLVRGRRIETKEEYKVYVANEVFVISPVIVAGVIAIPVLLALFIIVMLRGNKPKKAKKKTE